MALAPRYVADKSALAHAKNPAVDAVLAPLVQTGQIETCGIVEMEILFSAQSHADFVRTRKTRREAYREAEMLQADFDRARDVMEQLAEKGKHRSASIPDLLIAALAEREGLTILHYDADYDHIRSATGQPTQWVAPRGTL